ncbi:O-antigen ligase family protein [Chondrinema litorale]|uniref:O-antigen ligase family protein n=1 Tax=Chondrinema litorale TaxID=2994555 RepID=UPI0025434FCA|nr:O-antigen ligase family protein [Chondrinema litorale]UZS00142.1 O-antigen ligase family protein [Chondrinema litorale]
MGQLKKDLDSIEKDWSNLVNPVSIALLVYLLYIFIQIFNPNQLSYAGWLVNARQLFVLVLCYFMAVKLLDDINIIRRLLNIWIILCSLTSLYGCTQEWFGFMDMEERWINITTYLSGQVPFLHAGYMRKFSVFSDPTLFGVVMAPSSIVCFVLATGPFKLKKKIILIVAGILILLGMVYSGTRTAYAMIPAGFLLYFLMTIENRRTFIVFFIFSIIFIITLYAPIYGNRHINRIRTAFVGSEDASLKFRDTKRAASQAYVYEHPIGGGLETSGGFGLRYNKGHELNAIHIDSGFLKMALEIGWIGLFIYMMLFFIILSSGVNVYYRCRNKEIKVYILSIVAFIFSCLISMYTQKVIFQHPLGIFLFVLFAVIGVLKKKSEELLIPDS